MEKTARKMYTVSLSGYADETIFEMMLTEEEAILVKKMQELSESKSTNNYMPLLYIEEAKENQ